MVLKRLALICLLGYVQATFAWGDEGHRITGYVANQLISERTKQALRASIGTDDLSQVATWMDDERDELERRIPGSTRWHFENRATCDRSGREQNSCPNGNCITVQLQRLSAVARDRHANREQRADAVRMLVHLLGDVHQPLHLADNHDRGGNDVWVILPRERKPRRLHEVWDTRVVRMNVHRRSDETYAHALLARFDSERSTWLRGSLSSWAEDSYAIGRRAYQTLPHFACGTQYPRDGGSVALSYEYLDAARPIVDEQLTKAGVRIAAQLDALFSGQSSPQ